MTDKEEAKKILLDIIKSAFSENITVVATMLTAEADNDEQTII